MDDVTLRSPEEFGPALRRLRKERRLTQADLAVQVERVRVRGPNRKPCPYNALISGYERGKFQPTLAMLLNFAKVLRVRFIIEPVEPKTVPDGDGKD